MFGELYFPSDILRISRVYEMLPSSVSVNNQIAVKVHSKAEKIEVRL
jgi:hypothetical protein